MEVIRTQTFLSELVHSFLQPHRCISREHFLGFTVYPQHSCMYNAVHYDGIERESPVDDPATNRNVPRAVPGHDFAHFLAAANPAAKVLRFSTRYHAHSHAPVERWYSETDSDMEIDLQARAHVDLLRVVAGLVYNLCDLVPTRFRAHPDLSPQRFAGLAAGGIEDGIAILKALPRPAMGRVRVRGWSRKCRIMYIVEGLSYKALSPRDREFFFDFLNALDKLVSKDMAVTFVSERPVNNLLD